MKFTILAPALLVIAAVAAGAAPLHPVYPGQKLVRQGYLEIKIDDEGVRVVVSTNPDASGPNEDSVEVVNGAFTANLAGTAHKFGIRTLVEVTGEGNAAGQIVVASILRAPASELEVRERINRDAWRRYKQSYVPTGNPFVDAVKVTVLWKDDRDPRYDVTVENWGGWGTEADRRPRQFRYDLDGIFQTEVWP